MTFKYCEPNVKNCTFGHLCPAKIQISLRIRTVESESFWGAQDAKLLHADKEGSDMTARMHMLIWFFIGHTCYTL